LLAENSPLLEEDDIENSHFFFNFPDNKRANALLCTELSNIQNIIDENLIKNKQVIPYQINNNLFLLCSLFCVRLQNFDSSRFPSSRAVFSSKSCSIYLLST
jgi:hypothetical protein